MTSFREAFERLDRYIDRKMRETNAPGVAVAITDREKLLRQACYGYANLSARTPIAPEHLFEIASIGKSFTALALMQQHKAGRLDLHAPVSNYLPWFEIQSKFEPITTHHLSADGEIGEHRWPLMNGRSWPLAATSNAEIRAR